MSFSALGRHAEAVEALERAAALDPTNDTVRASLEAARAAATSLHVTPRKREAGASDAQLSEAHARETPRHDASCAPETPPPRRLDGRTLTELLGIGTERDAATGSTPQGGESAQSSHALSPPAPLPSCVPSFTARGLASLRKGDNVSALSLLTEALSNESPDCPVLLCSRSAAAHALGRFEEALADARRSVELAPDRARCHYRRGVAAASLRLWDEAAEALRSAIRLKPGVPGAAEKLALVVAALEEETEPERGAVPSVDASAAAEAEASPPGPSSPEPEPVSGSQRPSESDASASEEEEAEEEAEDGDLLR